MEIYIHVDLSAAQVSRLRASAPDAALHFPGSAGNDDGWKVGFLKSEVAFGNVPPQWIPESSNLKWLQLDSVGFGEFLAIDWAKVGKRVTVSNLEGFFAEQVAESCLAGLLAIYRGYVELIRAQGQKTWKGDEVRGRLRTLKGARATLFGYGSINRRLAELLRAFDCEISAFSRGWTPEELDASLSVSDIVACAAPDTSDTRMVFDRPRLERIRKGAVFANFGRGSLVDESSLANAVNCGRLTGAVIDVTSLEPLPQNHPFWDCEGIVLTQHSGGGDEHETNRKLERFLENLARYRRGNPLVGVVDFARGY